MKIRTNSAHAVPASPPGGGRPICDKPCSIRRVGVYPVGGDLSGDGYVIWVGRDPGRIENETGKPFTGSSGVDFLRPLIIEMRLLDVSRLENLVRCHTFNNVGPTDIEIETCAPYLLDTIFEIKPRYIVSLGVQVSNYFIGERVSMKHAHGKFIDVTLSNFGKSLSLTVMPTYHPSPRNEAFYDTIRMDVRRLAERMAREGLI